MNSSRKMALFAEELRAYRDDPVGFCENILGFEPHPGQQRWLMDSGRTENALVTGNRFGKSHIAAAKRIWKCAYRIGWKRPTAEAMARKHALYHSINVAMTADQARLVWAKAHAMLQGPKASWLVRDVKMTPFPTIEFVTGATFDCRSTTRDGTHLLGHDFDDVNWDEAAFEKRFERIRDNVLRMRLVDRAGTMDYTSTGNGRNAFGLYFLDGLNGKDPGLYSQVGSSFENPNIDQDRLRENMRRMPDRMRAQNIDGAIIDAGGGYFVAEDVEAAHDECLDDMLKAVFDNEERESWAEVFIDGRPYRDRYSDNKYVTGWDLAEKRDWTVGITLDITQKPFKLIEFRRMQKCGWNTIYDQIRKTDAKYGKRTTKIDSTGLGDVVENELRDIHAEGINFAGGRKDEMLTNLATRLSDRDLRWPLIRAMHDEIKFYERDDEGRLKDCVMALAVATWFAGKPRKKLAFGALSADKPVDRTEKKRGLSLGAVRV